MFKNYLITAVRNIKKNKAYSIINIFGLSIGIASAILIFLWVQAETGYDSFHQKGNQIYRILTDFEGIKGSTIRGAMAPTIKNEIPEIIDAVRLWTPNPWQLYYENKNIELMGNYADPSVFNIFTFPMLQGNAKTALIDHHSIVITESAAQNLFTDRNAVGKTIQIRNRSGIKESFNVTGVIKDIPKNSHIQFDFLFSFKLLGQWYRPDFGESWTGNSFTTYVLIKENGNNSLINKKLSYCYLKNTEKKRDISLQPLSDVYLNADVYRHSGGDYAYIKLFIGIAFFILLIACINYMNLATAYSGRRNREIGLRKTLGATKRQIGSSQLFESVFYSFAALGIAIFIVFLVQPLFNSLTGEEIALNFLDPVFLAITVLIALLTGVLSGYYPAFHLSSIQPINALKMRITGGHSASALRTVLIVFQFALASIIIISTLVTSWQMNFIENKNLGFDKNNLVYTWTSGYNNDAIRQELLKNPNIINAAGSGAQLDMVLWWQNVKNWEGHTGDKVVQYGILEVDYNFIDTYGIKLAEGRYYSKDFPSDPEYGIVINKSAVKAMQMDSPVGKTISFNGVDKVIVGVVDDFHWQSLHSDITPLLFVLYPKQLRCLGIKVRQDNIASVLPQIKEVISKIEPDYYLEYKFLDEQLNNLYIKEQHRFTLFGIFSFISIALSCMGLFGLISYAAEQRTKEIGIRKVLGASVKSIVFMISRDFLKWVLVANILAWPIAWYAMDKWLRNFAYRIDLTIWPFLLSGMFALVIALLTVNWKAIKAASANPISSLRSE